MPGLPVCGILLLSKLLQPVFQRYIAGNCSGPVLHSAIDFKKYNSFYGPAANRQVVYSLHKGVCCGCGEPIALDGFHVGHIIAQKEAAEFEVRFPGLDVHNLLNLHLLCPKCNFATNEHVMVSEFMLQRIYSQNARIITSRASKFMTTKAGAPSPELLALLTAPPAGVPRHERTRNPRLIPVTEHLRTKAAEHGIVVIDEARLRFPSIQIPVKLFPSPAYVLALGGLSYSLWREQDLYAAIRPVLSAQVWFTGGCYGAWVAMVRKQADHGQLWIRVDQNGTLTGTYCQGPDARAVRDHVRDQIRARAIRPDEAWIAIPNDPPLDVIEYQYESRTFKDLEDLANEVNRTAQVLASGAIFGNFVGSKVYLARNQFGRDAELPGAEEAYSIFRHSSKLDKCASINWARAQKAAVKQIPPELRDIYDFEAVYKVDEIRALNEYLSARYCAIKAFLIEKVAQRQKRYYAGLHLGADLIERLLPLPVPEVFLRMTPIEDRFYLPGRSPDVVAREMAESDRIYAIHREQMDRHKAEFRGRAKRLKQELARRSA
jgi:5-methylcytosine-specific restriction endonuclease McrA